MRRLAILMACVALAGCWQSLSRPYRNVRGVTPFASGAVTETGLDGEVQHYRLVRRPQGRYRFTSIDKGQDFGLGFDLGFFPLPGAPSNVLVSQAAALDRPRVQDSLRYYGLLVITGPKSADNIRPDCEKDWRAARASGTRQGEDGACTFADRAALEKSLLALWKSGKKAQYHYVLK
ncbi:MAG TPA: hypothetical protein VG821_05965 [Rhizomicrobium sp.]|jgi:hypothetical protein|nr:hypothetical protein [Rhizomicrobium sp.]